MSQYTKIVLEGDARGRASISALDTDGYGHGYRFAGPKYIGDIVNGVTAPTTFTVELDERDVDELHCYLRIWDEIHLGDQPPQWAVLVEASDRYRRAVTTMARCRTYPNFPTDRLGELEKACVKARAVLADAALALAAAMEQPEVKR